MDDQQLLLLPRHLLNGESDGRHWNIEDHVDVLTIVPLPRDLRADIGLELMIGGNDLDRLVGDLAAKFGDRHLSCRDRALPSGVGSGSRQIGKNAEFHDLIGDLCGCGMSEEKRRYSQPER